MYGNPETTPGGRALKFYSSVRLDVRKKDVIKVGSENVGNLVRVKVVKNKVAPPFREAEFEIIYGEGISRDGEIVDLATRLDILQKSGSWYSYNGQRIGQGRDKVKQVLRDNPAMAEEIAKKVMEQKDTLLGSHKPTPKPLGKANAEVPEMPEAPAQEQLTLETPAEAPAKRSSKMIDIEADDK